MRRWVLSGVLAVVAAACGAVDPEADLLDVVEEGEEAADAKGDGAPGEGWYVMRPDLRKCASPLCGGELVHRVNRATTRCADGTAAAECYVAEVDFSALGVDSASVADTGRLLVLGKIERRTLATHPLGVLVASQAWRAVSDDAPTGIYYRVKDRGVRCVAAPCPQIAEDKLNSTVKRTLAGVELAIPSAAQDALDQAVDALYKTDGLLVAGKHRRVSGAAGSLYALDASQAWLRVQAAAPCKRSGCSGQICSDRNVISTCQFKPEYACYRAATCERQADGGCGWTMTPTLSACLGQ